VSFGAVCFLFLNEDKRKPITTYYIYRELQHEKDKSFQENLFNINNWGDGYFSVNASGNIEITKSPEIKGVELQAIVKAAGEAGLQLPLLVRCGDILHDRVARIYRAFSEAKREVGYTGMFDLVYPIKVNQERVVVRDLLDSPTHSIGLEAGSKPELMAVIAMLGKRPGTIVCNGYKDSSYIRIALIAEQMGHKVYIVIEKKSEVELIINEACRMKIRPRLGVRLRLFNKCCGKWENSGGDRSKFGLNARQVLETIEQLKQSDMLDCLQLIHAHIGSQVASIQHIRQSMEEISRYYVELRQLNVPIDTVDVGGGLGVDFEGTHSEGSCSMNYTLKEYATHILLSFQHLCKEKGFSEPNIITESGRALTAHHAVLISSITDIETVEQRSAPALIAEDDHHVLCDIYDTYKTMSNSAPTEIYNYAIHALNEAQSLFQHGVISLQDKVKVESLYVHICTELSHGLDESNPVERSLLAQLGEQMAAKVFCNMSFFQSMPDAWAIGQVFPVSPITHLNEPFTMRSVLQDLTCDSDGTLKLYPGPEGTTSVMMLPEC
jgi:arginine decarboxylase